MSYSGVPGPVDIAPPSSPGEPAVDDRKRRLVGGGTWVVAVAALMLGAFLVAESADVPLLTADAWRRDGLTGVAVLVGAVLLLADVVLPVPSSLVMISLGASLGVPLAAVLSWSASTAAALVGFWLGRRMSRRARPSPRLARALDRWGLLLIVVTRPVPILAETTAITAGMVGTVGWRRTALGSLIGTLPPAVAYSAAGAWAMDAAGAVTLVLCGLFGVAACLVELIVRLARSREPVLPDARRRQPRAEVRGAAR